MRGQLKEASSVTSKAFCAFRKELDPDLEGLGQTGDLGAEDVLEETQMSPAITIMKPILRYLQLLCENHNSDLQVLVAIRLRTPSSSVAEIAGGLTSILSTRLRTSCAARTTKQTTTWCARLSSSWIASVEAPPEASACWAFTLMRATWTW